MEVSGTCLQVCPQGYAQFEEHDQLVLGSSRFQGFPFQVVQHRGHATCVMVSVCNIPGCSTLNHLDLLDIFLGIGTPNSRTIP